MLCVVFCILYLEPISDALNCFCHTDIIIWFIICSLAFAMPWIVLVIRIGYRLFIRFIICTLFWCLELFLRYLYIHLFHYLCFILTLKLFLWYLYIHLIQIILVACFFVILQVLVSMIIFKYLEQLLCCCMHYLYITHLIGTILAAYIFISLWLPSS